MTRVEYRRLLRVWQGVAVRGKDREEIQEMTAWCSDTGSNRQYAVHVMNYRDSYHPPAPGIGYAMFRFEDQNDAFAFKLRWK